MGKTVMEFKALAMTKFMIDQQKRANNKQLEANARSQGLQLCNARPTGIWLTVFILGVIVGWFIGSSFSSITI